MSRASIERFAEYSEDELARLLAELERGRDDRLSDLLAAIRVELDRRGATPPSRSALD
jgi:hypothetical protein